MSAIGSDDFKRLREFLCVEMRPEISFGKGMGGGGGGLLEPLYTNVRQV